MKKFCSVILALLLVCSCAVALAACKKEEPKEDYMVYFYLPEFYVDHPPTYELMVWDLKQKVKQGDKVAVPNLTLLSSDTYPCLNMNFYTFIGWFTEPGCINSWKFYETPVTCEMKLYAKFVPNWELSNS